MTKVEAIRKKHKSAAILCWIKKKTRETEGVHGFFDVKTGIKATKKGIYRVASISKVITALAAMTLYERGQLDLQDRVDQYLDYELINPHFKAIPIKISHLMTHTSTIKDYYQALYDIKPGGFQRLPKIRDIFFKNGNLHDADKIWHDQAAPGESESFQYSNLNTIVLAAIIERISGQRFDEYCRQMIFDPLKMNDSTFNLFELPLERSAPLYHHYDPEISEENTVNYDACERVKQLKSNGFHLQDYELGEHTSFFGPQGNLQTTLEDLKQLCLTMKDRTAILKKETYELMETTAWQGHALDGFYRRKGLNLHILDHDVYSGYHFYGHSGTAYGIWTQMYYDPQKDACLIFFVNGCQDNFKNGLQEIERELINTLLEG